MTNENSKRPILYKGEAYSGPISKKTTVVPKEPPIPFEEARANILNNIQAVKKELTLKNSTLHLPNETIVSFRMRPEYGAKSHYPTSLFYPSRASSSLEEVGSRIWRENLNDDEEQSSIGRLFFVRTTIDGLEEFEEKLKSRSEVLNDGFRWDIQKLWSLDLLKEDEQIIGFSSDWQEGRVEAVLHPFSRDRSQALPHFKNLLQSAGVDLNDLRIKQYEDDGITFVSLNANRQVLDSLKGYNPLRSIHPLQFRKFPFPGRTSSMTGSPTYPAYSDKVRPVLGILDGGYVNGNPALDRYVEYIDVVGGSDELGGPEHGTSVTAAALYGALNDYSNSDTLPEPEIQVRNFKVLSGDDDDPDMYDTIDAIEKIVPSNPDILVYNLSLGPNGPIVDDEVSRFTYACDRLTKIYKVLICVAIGNDGEFAPFDRIQSPSDMVNGLAIGAYTSIAGRIIRAPYSCKGPGREGGKMKPDLVAFGGCERNPIQLLSEVPNTRNPTSGTSFASPIASAMALRLIGASSGVVNPLTSRLLLIHSTSKEDVAHCHEMGHGPLPLDSGEVLSCTGNSYTLLYEADLWQKNYHRFEIPWDDSIIKGKVKLKWTVAALTPVDPSSPEDYTTSSVEVVICPNSNKYTFSKEVGGKKQTRRVDIIKDKSRADDLLADGWRRSEHPITEGGPNPFASETELRDELKWDCLDTRTMRKLAASIQKPYLYAHAIGRGHRTANEKVRFAIVLTVEVDNSSSDIYTSVITSYPNLVPIRIHSDVALTVTV